MSYGGGSGVASLLTGYCITHASTQNPKVMQCYSPTALQCYSLTGHLITHAST